MEIPIRFVRWLPALPRVAAMALPPVGIFIKISRWDAMSDYAKALLMSHETAHWTQYMVRGSWLRYYWDYVRLWLRYGYKNHPMEIEARG